MESKRSRLDFAGASASSDRDPTGRRAQESRFPLELILRLTTVRSMRSTTTLAVAILLLAAAAAHAGSGRIIKVLPHYLDMEGKHAVSPSLYERDAYQARLRSNPELVSGIRFDFKWRASNVDKDKLRIRIEVRGSQTLPNKPFVVEQKIERKGLFGRWSSATVSQEEYQKVGKMIAWQATLLEGDATLAQQRSFLWGAGLPETKSTPETE